MNIQRKNSAHHFRMQSKRKQNLANDKRRLNASLKGKETREELSTTCNQKVMPR